MNWHIINLVIGREYTTRVKKKSFLVITFLVPVLFAAMCMIPSLIVVFAKSEQAKVAVMDESGIVLPVLENNEFVSYYDYVGSDADTIKAHLDDYGLTALLKVSPLDTVSKSVSVDSYSKKPLTEDVLRCVNKAANKAVEDYRVESYGVENLQDIVASIHSDIEVKTFTLDKEGRENISSTGVYMAVSTVLGMIIYMFIAMFSGMVMSSVIEEKSSRVVEVLVSSVKATELMFGKIIGVALVALTQFFLWIVLTVVVVGVLGTVFGADISSMMAEANPTTEMTTSMTDSMGAGSMGVVISTLGRLPYGQMIFAFIVFFFFGYLLYASLFAAIGSAVENEADSAQLQIPVTIPLFFGFFIAFYAVKAPESALVFWGSMIPFTSPIVMLARLPYGVATWELALSIALLVLTFAICAWLSARVYKMGILTFGKKSTFKDLWKWIKMK